MMAPPRPARRFAAIALVVAASSGLACMSSASPGGFEDDLGDEEQALLPDLPKSECDPRRYNDCEDDQKCTHVEDEEIGPINRCVPLLGEGVRGDSCERIGDSDTCANHFICWGTDASGQDGQCMAFCTPSLDCGGIGEVCSVSTGGSLPLCLLRCDPLQLDSCIEGWGCYPDDYLRWSCDRDRSGEGGAHGQPCECLNCCDPGLICMPGGLVDSEACGDEGAAGCCGAVCELGDELPTEGVCPTPNETCEFFFPNGMGPMGYDHVGVCEL